MNNNKIKSKVLNIISLNINSLVSISKQMFLLHFLKKHNPDIMILCETKLNKKRKIKFKDYELVRKDRPNSTLGGGTAILIKKELKFIEIEINKLNYFQCLELCAISLKINDTQNLTVIAAYASQRNSSKFNEEWEKAFEFLHLNNIDKYYIIAGDINAKHSDWGNINNNPRGNFIKKWLYDKEMYYKCSLYSTLEPSFPRSGSYLDLVFTDTRLEISTVMPNKIKTLPFDSDHYASIFKITLDNNRLFKIDRNLKGFTYNYKKTDWNKFSYNCDKSAKEILSKDNFQVKNNRNLTNDEIDTYIVLVDKIIKNAVEKTVPKFKSYNSMDRYNSKELIKLHKHKSKILSEIKKLNRINNKNNRQLITLKSLIKNINILIKENINKESNKYWENKIRSITPKDSVNMFPILNKIFRNKNQQEIEKLKIPIGDSTSIGKAGINARELHKEDIYYCVNRKKDIVNLLGHYIEETHMLNNRETHRQFTELVNGTVREFNDNISGTITPLTEFSSLKKSDNLQENQTENNYFTTIDRLSKIVFKLKNKISAGIDGVPNIVLKHMSYKIISMYSIIFNNCLNNSYFPKSWKRAKIICIKKPGKDPSNPKNLRSINMLPNCSKILEILINENINNFNSANNIIPDNQFGFKRFHSSVHAINKLTSDICWHLNNRECLGACLVDLKEAFNSVWLNGLIYKLIQFEFPIQLVKIIQDMIKNKSFIICNGKTTSTKIFHVENGLQQGTVNAPILFNIFFSGLLKQFNGSVDRKGSIAFADDLTIYATGSKIEEIQRKLQYTLDETQNYVNSWKLRINYSKCELILFRPTVDKTNNDIKKNWKHFKLKTADDTIIASTKKVKYLGIVLNFNLNYKIHVTNQIEKARKAFSIAKNLFHSKALLPRVKVLAYQSLIRPILTYGCPIWYNVNPSNMELLRKFERKCIRHCIGKFRKLGNDHHYFSNKTIYEESKINKIDSFIIKLTRNYFNKLSEIENSLVLQLANYDMDYIKSTLESGFIPPEAFIYLDQNKYIQNDAKIPIIYHINRNSTDKRIKYPQNFNIQENIFGHVNIIKFDTYQTKRDLNEKTNKYWWLN